mgnify:FL=1
MRPTARKSRAELLENPLAPLRMGFHAAMQSLLPHYQQLRDMQADPTVKKDQLDAYKQQLSQAADQVFGEPQLEQLFTQLQRMVEADHTYNAGRFAEQCERARYAIRHGELPEDRWGRKPHLHLKESPAAQLVWAATLAYITLHPKVQEHWPDEHRATDKWDVASTTIWQDIEELYSYELDNQGFTVKRGTQTWHISFQALVGTAAAGLTSRPQ